MRKHLIVVFILAFCKTSLGQQPDSIARKKFPHFTTFTEAGGSALFYSQNVEFFVSNNRTVNINLRAGIGYIDGDEIRVPVLINSIIGRKKSKLELGIGMSFPTSMTATIAYRHQNDNGMFYRVAFTPLLNNYETPIFLPWGGLSLGYYFGYRKTKVAVKPVLNIDSTDNKLNLIVKTDLLGLGFFLSYKMGYGSLTIEKGFKKRHSTQLTVIYTGYKRNNSYSDTTWYNQKINEFHIIPEYKYFFGRRRYYSGFYSGIYAKYLHEKEHGSSRSAYNNYPQIYENTYFSNILTVGIIVGYQNYIFKRRIVIDILAGVGYGYYYSKTQAKWHPHYPDGRLALNIGYRF